MMLLRINHCSICVKALFILPALLTFNSFYGFSSPLLSSILSNSASASNSSFIVFLLIKLPNSTFLYTKFVCWGVKQSLCLKLFLLFPPEFWLIGKNAAKPLLPSISLNRLWPLSVSLFLCHHLCPSMRFVMLSVCCPG